MDMRISPWMRRVRTATVAAVLIAPATLQSSTFADDAPPSNGTAAVQSTSHETPQSPETTDGQATTHREQAAPARKPTLVERVLGIRKNKPTPQRNAKTRGHFQRKNPQSPAQKPAAKPAQVAQEEARVETAATPPVTAEKPVAPEAVEPRSPFTGLTLTEDPAGMQELAASAESAAPAQADEPVESFAGQPQIAAHEDPFDLPEAMVDESPEDLENLDLNDEQLASPISVKETEQEIAESTQHKNSKWNSKQKHPLQSVKHADGADEAAEQHEHEEVIAETKSNALDSICLVSLRDKRRLVTGRPEFSTTVKGHKHLFASAAAKAVFDANPTRYLPVADGCDVVLQASGEEGCEGSLEKAVWYSSRLYLFATPETLQMFVSTPEKYAVE